MEVVRRAALSQLSFDELTNLQLHFHDLHVIFKCRAVHNLLTRDQHNCAEAAPIVFLTTTHFL
jgi:hypothetical protein